MTECTYIYSCSWYQALTPQFNPSCRLFTLPPLISVNYLGGKNHLNYLNYRNLLLQALKFFSNHKQFFDKLVDISLVSLAKDGGSKNGFCLSSAIVNFVLQKDGIQCARQMYKRYVFN